MDPEPHGWHRGGKSRGRAGGGERLRGMVPPRAARGAGRGGPRHPRLRHRAGSRLPGGDLGVSHLCGVLGIRAGSKVSVVNPSPGFVVRLNPLPDGVEFLVTAQTGLDVVLYFARSAGELLSRLPALARSIALPGRIWVAWEEGSSALDEDIVRQAGPV